MTDPDGTLPGANKVRTPLAGLFWSICALCVPGIVALLVGIPEHYLEAAYRGNWTKSLIYVVLANLGGGAMIFTLFVGLYLSAFAGALLIVFSLSKRVASKKKAQGAVVVGLSFIAYWWVLHLMDRVYG